MDGVTRVPPPRNEPVLSYAPGSPERAALGLRLTELTDAPFELPMTIGGRARMGRGGGVEGGQRMGRGAEFEVVQPHRHAAVLGRAAHAARVDAEEAVRAAKDAARGWQ